jgi:hypothetical protein
MSELTPRQIRFRLLAALLALAAGAGAWVIVVLLLQDTV